MIDVGNDGMVVTRNVVETIVSLAIKDIEDVVSVGTPSGNLIHSVIRSVPAEAGIELDTNEDGELEIGLHLNVRYGNPLPVIADEVRAAVSDAISMQLGMQVAKIDVYIDSIRFAD